MADNQTTESRDQILFREGQEFERRRCAAIIRNAATRLDRVRQTPLSVLAEVREEIENG